MNDNLPDELLDTLTATIDSLRQRLFAFDLNQGSKRDSYKNIDFLVECLCLWEKHPDKLSIRNFDNLEYYFLKRVLETNAPLFYQEQNVLGSLGLIRDRSPLTVPEQNRISVQVMAQILWHLEGDRYLKMTTLSKELHSNQHLFAPMLGLEEFHNEKTFYKWISPMFPVPSEERKKHWDRDNISSQVLMPIPGILSESGINFAKLRFAAQQITRILRNREWLLSQILYSKFIQALEELLPEPLRIFVREWAAETPD